VLLHSLLQTALAREAKAQSRQGAILSGVPESGETFGACAESPCKRPSPARRKRAVATCRDSFGQTALAREAKASQRA
jgi:hypothetical protein